MDRNKIIKNLPRFLGTLKPIKYYKYKSLLKENIIQLKYSTVGYKDNFIGTKESIEKHDDNIIYYNWFKKLMTSLEKENPEVYFNTNKIVLECMTPENNHIYIGWCDGTLSIGFGRNGDLNVKPINLNQKIDTENK